VELVADVPARPAEAGEPGERVAGTAAASACGRSGGRTSARVGLPVLAEAVIQRALVRIGQDGVGLVDRLEPLLRVGIPLVLIGVVLTRSLPNAFLMSPCEAVLGTPRTA
jgi:hypothetical protein